MDERIRVPGPTKEIARVREIYRLTITDRRSAKSIAREFNRKGSKCGDAPWTSCRILTTLKCTRSIWANQHGVGPRES